MAPDSAALVNAVIAKLNGDTPLLALVPNGVYEDVGPPGATKFVVVSLIIGTDTSVFVHGRVIEDLLLLIEARVRFTGRNDVGAASAAAARIDALLEDGTVDAAGYLVTAIRRDEPVHNTEVDEVDPTIRWKRRGGRYRLTAYRSAVAP
jgi:hypothetical protein